VFNAVSTETKYNPDCDLNKDGSINMSDVIVVAKNFGKVSNDYVPVIISKITA
jgi:hypothetical protein